MKFPGTWFACLLSCLLVLAPSITPAASDDLEVTISTDPSLAAAGSITFTVKNVSSQPVRVLTWNTPLEGAFTSKSFNIFKNGTAVKYTGKLVKRGKPKDSDYLTIEPGDSVSAVAALPEAYDMASVGDYEAAFTGLIQYQIVKTDPATRASRKETNRKLKQSNKLLLKVTTPPKPIAAYKQAASYTVCSTEQITILDEALTEAERIALDAADALTSTNPAERATAGRYTAWFGSYTDTRYATAVTHFDNLADAISNETIEFMCDCTEEYLAWVYPNQPYKIHLCNQYWQAPLAGTDSQSGTIIHEMTHFVDIADTNDYVYGQGGAFDLAMDVPDLALDNADNHEYFAENSPALPMRPLFGLSDNYGNAPLLTNLNAYSMTDNYGATKETGEPAHAANAGGASIWFSWQAPATGPVSISTLGSWVDTLLGVYTGGSVSSLTEIASNDDFDYANSIYQSKVSFPATAGQIYHVAIDGYYYSGSGPDTGMIYVALNTDSGDLNGSDVVGLEDAILGLQLLTGTQPAAPVDLAADINGNARVEMAEVLFILNHLSD